MFYRLYGEGGFDASKPNNNIIEEYEIPDLPPTEQEIARQSAISKLKTLGLTDGEIQALIG